MARFSLFGGTDPATTSQADDSVAVLGLGRFGSSVALELMSAGAQVLGVDSDPDTVQRHNTKLTHVVRTTPPHEITGRPLGEVDCLARHQVSVVAVKPRGGRWLPTTAQTVLGSEDTIQVIGTVKAVETFAHRT